MNEQSQRPFSQACENNRGPILEVLEPRLQNCRSVLEIGSGTGQHAVYFAGRLPQLVWQTSDLPQNHPGIHQWLADYPGSNLRPPLSLDMAAWPWPVSEVDAVFTANTFHIAAWTEVLGMLDGCARVLPTEGQLIVYGPFNENGEYSSESNARFDQHLRQSAAHQGIRDRQQVAQEALIRGLELQETISMPANNCCLVFRRIEESQ